MKQVTIFAVMLGSLLLGACSSNDGGEPSQSRPLRLNGVIDGCKDVEQACAMSEPPICHDYCADEDPGEGGDDCLPMSNEYQMCGTLPCAVGVDSSGQEFQVCYPSNCTVSFDANTQTETIDCPPGVAPGSPPGGSDPGNPGIAGGSEPPGTGGGATPGSGGDGPKGL